MKKDSNNRKVKKDGKVLVKDFHSQHYSQDVQSSGLDIYKNQSQFKSEFIDDCPFDSNVKKYVKQQATKCDIDETSAIDDEEEPIEMVELYVCREKPLNLNRSKKLMVKQTSKSFDDIINSPM